MSCVAIGIGPFLLCQNHPSGEREEWERGRRRANLFLVTWVDPRRENCPSSFVAWTTENFYSAARTDANGGSKRRKEGREDGALTRRCLPPPSLSPSGSVAYSGHVSPAFVAACPWVRLLVPSLSPMPFPYLGTNSRERAEFDKNFLTANPKNQY